MSHVDLDAALRRAEGAATREQLLHVLGRTRLDHEIRVGRLVSVFARTYCRPWDVDDPRVRDRAAVLSVAWPVVLSHTSALRRWEVLEEKPDAPIHVCTPAGRCPRPKPGLTPHRVRRLPRHVRMGLVSVADPAAAVISSWPLNRGVDRRAPAIAVVRRRLVSAEDLRAELVRHPRVPGRRELEELIALLADGCESELEIWGHQQVFDVPGLRHGVRQRVLAVRGRRYRLDLAFDAERVAVELDGYAYHSSREQREYDMRRDADLASIGWLTLRFSHARLHADPVACRHDLLRALAARR